MHPPFARRPPRPRLRKAYTGHGDSKTLLSNVLLVAHRHPSGHDMRATRAIPSTTAATKADLFGHPRGLSYLFATEMWERFSTTACGRSSSSTWSNSCLIPKERGTVIGLGSFRTVLEAIFGPLGAQPFASQIYGFYTGLVYLTPIFGGLLADRVLGQRRTVIIGATLMAIGHFMMAFEQLFLFALGLLILGNGAFKPNISTQVGALCAGRPPPRPRILDFLCRYQSWRVSRTARMRDARRRARLALRVCRRRLRHDAWPCHLSAGSAVPAQGCVCTRQIGSNRFDRDGWRSIFALLLLFAARQPVLGHLRTTRQYHRPLGRSVIPTAHFLGGKSR